MGKLLYLGASSDSGSQLFSRISGKIKEFYSSVELVESPTVGGDFYFKILTVDKLEVAQSGWAGPDDKTLNWKESFVLFGDRNGDALIFDSAHLSSPVYGSVQKRSYLISPSFSGFLKAIMIGWEIEELEFGGDTREEDMSYKTEFLKRVESRLSVLGDEVDVNGFAKFFFT